MKDIYKCLICFTILSILSFIVGRLLPKKIFRYERFPYKPFKFERGGKIYIKLGIRKWKSKLPDMSRILPSVMPSKYVPKTVNASNIRVMLAETCVAEWVHKVLVVFGLIGILLWSGALSTAVTLAYTGINIMYVIVQRYSRPKLVTVLERLEKAETSAAA